MVQKQYLYGLKSQNNDSDMTLKHPNLVFEWCHSSSASRQSPCNRGPRVTTSVAKATRLITLPGDISKIPAVATAASRAAQSFGKLPRGRGIRESSSRRHCICVGPRNKKTQMSFVS